MFGWFAHYVKYTQGRIRTEKIDPHTKVLRPAGNNIPVEPFYPFLNANVPMEPVKERYKRKVYYLETQNEGFYIKKYSYRLTSKHYASLRGFIWNLPMAQRQLQKMLYLRECGAEVAEPMMVLVRRYRLIKQESLLVMRECPGVLLKQFMKEVDDFERRLGIIGQTFQFLSILHRHKIHHGDLTTHNFIIDAMDKVRAIDLDERKTKWLGVMGNKKELEKWVRRSLIILNIQDESLGSERRKAFGKMLEDNYPLALNYYDKLSM